MSIHGLWLQVVFRLGAWGRDRRRGGTRLAGWTCLAGLGWLGTGLIHAEPASADPATNAGSNYTVRTWTTKQGLPENTVTALYQTRDGYLWVGTPDGLACFDGVQFHRYSVANGLPHVGITALAEDPQGVLWVGTEHGLARCAGSRQPFPKFTSELPGAAITGLGEDAAGHVWIGTDRGLYRWADKHLTRMDGTNGIPRQIVNILFADHTGAVWLWGSSSKLIKIQPGTCEIVPVDFPLPRIRSVRAMTEDHAGRLWLSIGNGYLLCRENGAWKKYGEAQGVPYFYVASLAETTDGTLWAGSYGKGLFYQQADRFYPAMINPEAADDYVHIVYPDREGNLWVGSSSSGLACLRRKQVTTLAAGDGLTNAVVHGVAELADGSLVAATEDGLFREHAGQFKRQWLSKADTFVWTRCVLPTSDGNLWWAADMLLFDLNTFVKMGFNPPSLPADRTRKTVLCLFEDRQHQLWAGSVGNQTPHMGTSLWRIVDGKFVPVPDMPGTFPVQALAQAPDGTMYAGTDNTGFYALHPGNPLHFTTKQGLGSDSVRALYFDSAGVLWIGTRSGGLSRLKDGIIFTYSTRAGLVNDTISQILEDDEGALWLGSNRGISRVSKLELDAVADGKADSLHPLNLGEEDGMEVEECSGGTNPSSLKSRTGLLYFSTLKGIVVVDPKRFRKRGAPPSVVIEELLINGQVAPSAPAIDNHAPGSLAHAEPPEISLPPGQNTLEFHYTGLHSTMPTAITFRYRLEGLDPAWVNAGTRRFANYAQIPPGHYRFEVLAANRDGAWPESGAIVNLFLRPYLYQTWWFQAGMLGLGALTLTLLVRANVKRRLQQRLQRLELEQTLESERRRIARDLHDELGARLTGIAHLGELAMRDSLPPGDVKQQVGFITQRIRQLMGAMDEVVWTINPKNDSLPNIVAFLSDYAERFLDLTGIRWRLEADPEFPAVPVSAQVRHNLLMAAKETLNNTVRHAAATLIEIHIHVENDWLRVVISDNGHGFESGQTRPGGNGLANIRSRMELVKGRAEIRSSAGQGTTVILHLPLPGMDERKPKQ